jgi:hypothetical protein
MLLSFACSWLGRHKPYFKHSIQNIENVFQFSELFSAPPSQNYCFDAEKENYYQKLSIAFSLVRRKSENAGYVVAC